MLLYTRADSDLPPPAVLPRDLRDMVERDNLLLLEEQAKVRLSTPMLHVL